LGHLSCCFKANGEEQIWIGEINLKMFDAMIFKRKIGTTCNVEVSIIDTLSDGLVLSIDENSVNNDSLAFITDLVNNNKLNLLLENERYFISTQMLTPEDPYRY